MTPEQRELVELARSSLDTARGILAMGQPGFAVSRAYYTMFYIAEAFLLGEGLTYSRHTGVHSGLNQHFVRTGRMPAEFYTYLVQAFVLRQQGDYSTKPISPERAAEQIARAERFIRLAEEQL